MSDLQDTGLGFESQELLEALFHVLPVGLFVMDQDGTILFGNESLRTILGWKDPMIGVSIAEFFPRERRLDLHQMHQRLFRDNPQGVHAKVELENRQGQKFQALVRANPYQSALGENLMVGTLQDVSEEERLRLHKEASDKIILHDLKSPVSGMMGLAQLLIMEMPGSECARDMSALVIKQGTHLLNKMEAHLALSRIEEGFFTLIREPVSIEKIIYQAQEEWLDSEHTEGKHWEVTLEPFPETGTQFASNEILLRTAIGQLLRNAAMATPKGGTIGVRAAFDREGTLRLTLSNPGSLPASVLEKPFQPLPESTVSGMGMGLYTASQFVIALGGCLELSSVADPVVFEIVVPNGPSDGGW